MVVYAIIVTRKIACNGGKCMSKNKVEVVIGGLIYALQGEESEGHIQRVAKLVNEKIHEVQAVYHKQHVNPARLNMLITLNIADECVKSTEELERYIKELDNCNEENRVLKERVKELTLELTETRKELAIAEEMKKQFKKKEHTNRGR